MSKDPLVTDLMAAELSASQLARADEQLLQIWAYGRAATHTERVRARVAATELHRRAALVREQADRAARAQATAQAATEGNTLAIGAGRDALGLPQSLRATDTRRHRQRMLITGLAGVTAAALALGVGVTVITQPRVDPLDVFERHETHLDRNWAERLTSWGLGPFTSGPKAIELDDQRVIIVARVSTVPDGRSTAWDSYCLFLASAANTGDDSWGLSAACTYPEKFEREGLTVPDRPSATGDGFDTAFWGPEGEPRFARNEPLRVETGLVNSVLDWMSLPMNVEPASGVESLFGEPDRLLMGPVVVPVVYEGDAARVFREATLVTSVLVISGERPTESPLLCVRVAVSGSEPRMPCTDLGVARREGVEVPITVDGRTLVVTIGADGRERTDTVRLIG